MVTVFAEIESIEVEGAEGEAGSQPSAPAEGRQPRAKAGMIGSRGARQPSGESADEPEPVGESALGPSDVVPIQYAAVPGTTTNIPGTHAYPLDQEGKVGVPALAGVATVKVKLAEPHSGSFEIKVGIAPAGTLTLGKCRLMLAEG